MIVLKNAQSLFKRVRNSFKRVRILHQAFLITACKRPKTQGQPHFFEEPLSVLGLGNALRN
ncbi:hypothetical protein KVL45_00150 [Helicobacter pylori]|nr:hypothetical protein KVL45_00150 [Helicobacter pylori]